MQRESATERSFRRRLMILSLLHRGPLTLQQIIATLEQEGILTCDAGDDSDAIHRKRVHQFRHDLQALRRYYPIQCDQKTKYYALIDSPFGFSMDGQQLTTFSLVLHTFADMTHPQAHHIKAFFAFLMSRLPENQQHTILTQRRAFSIEVSEGTDHSAIDISNQNHIDNAILRGQQLEFTYLSPRTGREVHHILEPFEHKLTKGHAYLYGWSPQYEKELQFRVDYMLPGTARMLPKRCQRTRPPSPSYLLRYHLTSTIARNNISTHFPEQRVEVHPDGSATVTAHITDLFDARQTLLKYGEHCVIESPPQLVEHMKIIAAHFAQIYLT